MDQGEARWVSSRESGHTIRYSGRGWAQKTEERRWGEPPWLAISSGERAEAVYGKTRSRCLACMHCFIDFDSLAPMPYRATESDARAGPDFQVRGSGFGFGQFGAARAQGPGVSATPHHV